MKRWYTCTPVSFKGDHTFFFRDSGLFSQAFAMAGCESKAVMPLPAHDGDWPDLIRTEYANLEDPGWWSQFDLDGVLLYSWGAPRFERVARAIRQSGAKLLIYLDIAGGFYPYHHWLETTTLRLKTHSLWSFPWFMVKSNLLFPLLYEPKRKRHLLDADMILSPLPSLVDQLKKPFWKYGEELARRIELVCCPVASHFDEGGVNKRQEILAVGRWDDVQAKRPGYLRKTLELTLHRHPSATARIVGGGADAMRAWRDGLPGALRERVTVLDRVPNDALTDLYREAQIVVCTSAWESTHIASAEGLCCGCSVVAPAKSTLKAFPWYVSEQSGSISRLDTPESLADALVAELRHWEEGRRDAHHISCVWTKRFHALESVRRILEWDETGVMPGFAPCSR